MWSRWWKEWRFSTIAMMVRRDFCDFGFFPIFSPPFFLYRHIVREIHNEEKRLPIFHLVIFVILTHSINAILLSLAVSMKIYLVLGSCMLCRLVFLRWDIQSVVSRVCCKRKRRKKSLGISSTPPDEYKRMAKILFFYLTNLILFFLPFFSSSGLGLVAVIHFTISLMFGLSLATISTHFFSV